MTCDAIGLGSDYEFLVPERRNWFLGLNADTEGFWAESNLTLLFSMLAFSGFIYDDY